MVIHLQIAMVADGTVVSTTRFRFDAILAHNVAANALHSFTSRWSTRVGETCFEVVEDYVHEEVVCIDEVKADGRQGFCHDHRFKESIPQYNYGCGENDYQRHKEDAEVCSDIVHEPEEWFERSIDHVVLCARDVVCERFVCEFYNMKVPFDASVYTHSAVSVCGSLKENKQARTFRRRNEI